MPYQVPKSRRAAPASSEASEGASPDEVVQQIGRMSGCPVVLENLAHQVLTYAQAGADPSVLHLMGLIKKAQNKMEEAERHLRSAVARFRASPADISGRQARLNFYNARENWLTRGIMAQTPQAA